MFVFFVLTARGYGIFRDELYYLACAQHLDWGYVDHPPLVALIAAAARALVGDSLTGLRAVPALAFALTVHLVGQSARALGGGSYARLLAQLATATAPCFLALYTIFSMNAFDGLIWAGLARLWIALLTGGEPRLWLAFGALAGVGLENKISVGFLGAGVLVALVATGRFEPFRRRWFWLGGALAAALFLPHLLWQAAHDWPTLEFMANARRYKIRETTPLGFVAAQIGQVGPVAAALAAAGAGWLLVARAARACRPLGVAALAVLALLAVSTAKPYYFAPAFTLLFPAGAAAVERWTVGRLRRTLRVAVTLAVASILVAAPLAKPLLSADAYVRYAARLGVAPGTDENQELGRLPQFFADMHGWRELAEAVARVHAALPPADRARACVATGNYGEAGAIDFFGPALGLPRAISRHNSYWLWGPGGCTGEVVIVVGGELEDLAGEFASVERGGVSRCTDCMPYEDGLSLWVARGLAVPVDRAWRAERNYI